ncbi:hypothetical protein F5141DRAFT_1252827 [Pisolithus sp. B1]|nr:hypothetical protein F5141DRAFT_1252827 [Pisolithus sp. B1]
MAPEPPKFDGLFTVYDCPVTKISWYKKQNGVEHEFLRFDILSPNGVHTSIVIAERDATQPTDTVAPLDTTGAVTPPDVIMPSFSSQEVVGDSTISSANESSPHINEVTKTDGRADQLARHLAHITSMSSCSQRGAHDLVSYATLDSSASAELERKCKKAACICTLTFPEGVRPSANEVATLLYVTSKHEPTYTITSTQCYWVRIRTKGSVDEVCSKYSAARTALAEEAEQKRRAEQQQEEERRREREQRQAAEEVPKREHEKHQAAEEQRQAAEEQCQVAEEQRQAAEEQRQAAEEQCQAAEEQRQAAEEQRQAAEEQRWAAEEQRQAAEEERVKAVERARAAEDANARLVRDLEALRRKLST